VSWTHKYREDIEELEEEVEGIVSRKQAIEARKVLDHLLPFALLTLLFVVLAGLGIPLSGSFATFVTYLNYAVIAYFIARLAIGFRLAQSNKKFFKNHWLDFALVIPAFSLLQEVRLMAALEDIEILGIDSDTIASSAIVSRNAGVFAKLSRIIRIVKRSV